MKKIFCLAAHALALASCEKMNEGLTRIPIDDVSPDAFFTSESECQLWLNRCYNNYLTVPVSSCQWCSDDCVSNDMNPVHIHELENPAVNWHFGHKFYLIVARDKLY